MQAPRRDDYVAEFVAELIRAGVILAELLDQLGLAMDEAEADAAAAGEAVSGAGEGPGPEALQAMLVETVRPAVAAAGERTVRAITPVFEACVQATLEELEQAMAALARAAP